jgi:hypothetical protein
VGLRNLSPSSARSRAASARSRARSPNEALGSRGILRRAAIDRQPLHPAEEEVLEKVVGFLSDEADRLNAEIVDRLRLGERSRRRRTARFVTSGTAKLVGAFLLGAVAALAGSPWRRP